MIHNKNVEISNEEDSFLEEEDSSARATKGKREKWIGCVICNGLGKISDDEDSWTCSNCIGVGGFYI